ncbi:hypothetical protein N7540_001934 [Penicillium herquei]|nr:hypothetical protein N7540_001934 [Penicillium herquei]
MISSPQQFLAQAQARARINSTHVPAEATPSNSMPPNTQQGKQAQVKAALEEPKNEITPPASAVVPETPTPASRKPSGQKSVFVKDEIPVQLAETIRKLQLSSKEFKLPDHTGFTAGSINSKEDKSKTDNVPTKTETLTGILLEIESTFDTPDASDISKNPLNSPGIAQLTGLNFDQPSREDSAILAECVRQAQDVTKIAEALETDLNTSVGDPNFDAEKRQQAWYVIENCYQAVQTALATIRARPRSGMQSSNPQLSMMNPVIASPETVTGIPAASSQPVLEKTINQPSNTSPNTSLNLNTPSKPLADSFKEYRSPPRTPSSQDSKEDMASEISPPTPLRNRVLKAKPMPTQSSFKEWKMPPEEWNPTKPRDSIPSKELSSKASTAVELEGTTKALAESIHARKPSAEINTGVDVSRLPYEKLESKIFGPPQLAKRDFSKKTAVAVSHDFNESQSAVFNAFNESQRAVPKIVAPKIAASPKQVRIVGPAPWSGFKTMSSNVPSPAVKPTGSEPDSMNKLHSSISISQDPKPSPPVSKMPRVIGPQPYQGPRK